MHNKQMSLTCFLNRPPSRPLSYSSSSSTNFCVCSSPPMSPPCHTGLFITADKVRKELERLNQSKSAGPDGISPCVLKACARQLCGVLQHLFNLSLHFQRVPLLWKTSCLIPVPMNRHYDYKPIALTSHLTKVMERLVLAHL